MSTSGSFTGNRGGNDYGPRLILEWSRTETDISRNRSRIKLTLKVDPHKTYGAIYASGNKTGKLHGSSFTYTGGFNGTATKTINTRNVWVNHKSDGSASVSFSATFNIDLTWHGSKLNSISVSGTANIRDIPRASGLTAFSLSSSSIAESTSRTIRYTLDRKSSSFSHAISLRLGNRTIKSWTDSGTGSRTESLTTSNANTILKALSSTTSGTLTLRVQTKSGNTNIGSAVTRTTAISVASSVSPSASGMSTSISGSGRDDAINRYVQSITRVYASFTRSAGYGASISSTSIVVRRVSGGSNSQTISGRSGTTSNPVSLSGTYEAIGTVRDSRGRSATSRSTFTVQAYSSPRISKFTAARTTSNPATVSVTRNGSYTSLSGLNPTDVEVHKRARNSTSWTRINNLSGHTSGSFGTSFNDTGNSEASTYEFRLTVTDSFGNSARSTVNVGTSFLELTISKGKGIGVGKVWERGSLDVNGAAYFKGEVRVEGVARILDYLSVNYGNTNEANERMRIEYRGSDGTTAFAVRRNDGTWRDRFLINGRDGDSVSLISPGTFDVRDKLVVDSLYARDGYRLKIGAGAIEELMTVYAGGAVHINEGHLYVPSAYNTTTSLSANITMGTNARFVRSTSARKYKMDIEPSGVDPYKILDLEPKSWIDKSEYEENGNSTEGLTRYYGIIADEMAEVGLPEYTVVANGEIENIVERAWTLLLPVVKKLVEDVNELKKGEGVFGPKRSH